MNDNTKQEAQKNDSQQDAQPSSGYGYIAPPVKEKSQVIINSLSLLFAAKRAAGLVVVLLLLVGVSVVVKQTQNQTKIQSNASFNACDPKTPLDHASILVDAHVNSIANGIFFSWNGFSVKNTESKATSYLLIITDKTKDITVSYNVTAPNNLAAASYSVKFKDLPGGVNFGNGETYSWSVYGQDNLGKSCPANPSKTFILYKTAQCLNHKPCTGTICPKQPDCVPIVTATPLHP